ncbi:MAG: hypothetical protein HPY87_10170 [Fervidobacterium sp.]|uniref:bifunctional DNA primase/polymerase n=1 Tax=Fervidobacterium sp. TaxID=1871331 RepID=UPI0025C5901E|nr:bifunctional DNA primase/polymerase [Fervidobacterium sp.]NPU90224.1 hypothetical protein [Fervidobacterium sp.]
MSNNSLYRIAEFWYDKGILAIPVIPFSKVPCVRWSHFYKFFPEKDILKVFFPNDDFNIALLCGENLTVVDFDDYDLYLQWEKTSKGIWRAVINHGMKVKTPRGIHLYVKTTDEKEYSRRFDPLCVDIKAKRGIVITSPSTHPSGEKYHLINGDIINVGTTLDVFPEINDKTCIIERIESYERERECNNVKSSGKIQDIKTHINIIDIVLRYTKLKKGYDGWYVGRCVNPSHKDRHPSFVVNDNYQLCKCFSTNCALNSKWHDVIDLFMIISGTNRHEVIETLYSEIAIKTI